MTTRDTTGLPAEIARITRRLNDLEARQTRFVTRGIWVPFTPQLTAVTTSPTLGAGAVAEGAWWRGGDLVVGHARITFGAGPAAGSGTYRVSLPVDADVPQASGTGGEGIPIGTATMRDDSGSTFRAGILQAVSPTTALLFASESSVVTDASPWTWDTDDTIGYTFTYRAAA